MDYMFSLSKTFDTDKVYIYQNCCTKQWVTLNVNRSKCYLVFYSDGGRDRIILKRGYKLREREKYSFLITYLLKGLLRKQVVKTNAQKS